jgi:hypothetical protein
MLLNGCGAGMPSAPIQSFTQALSYSAVQKRIVSKREGGVSLNLERWLTSTTESGSVYLKGVKPWCDGYAGYDLRSRALGIWDGEGGMVSLRPNPGIPLSSVHVGEKRIDMMSHTGAVVWQQEGRAETIEIQLKEIPGPNPMILHADVDSAYVYAPGSKRLHRFDGHWRPSGGADLFGVQQVRAATPCDDGLLLVESFVGGGLDGNLLYCSIGGDCVYLAGGLSNPTHVSYSGNRVLVCDFNGLFLFRLKDLWVVDSLFIPWHSLLDGLGLERGVGYEAFERDDRLYIALKHSVPLIRASWAFSLLRCRLDGL